MHHNSVAELCMVWTEDQIGRNHLKLFASKFKLEISILGPQKGVRVKTSNGKWELFL
jgi:hypothetical protein